MNRFLIVDPVRVVQWKSRKRLRKVGQAGLWAGWHKIYHGANLKRFGGVHKNAPSQKEIDQPSAATGVKTEQGVRNGEEARRDGRFQHARNTKVQPRGIPGQQR